MHLTPVASLEEWVRQDRPGERWKGGFETGVPTATQEQGAAHSAPRARPPWRPGAGRGGVQRWSPSTRDRAFPYGPQRGRRPNRRCSRPGPGTRDPGPPGGTAPPTPAIPWFGMTRARLRVFFRSDPPDADFPGNLPQKPQPLVRCPALAGPCQPPPGTLR